ncbi:hypothetical protein GGX14DRAFT_596506 [Mycena pura]|uniref:Uncharacterized protein n=1 Tax=Mycena pura TaxID=153505 RepID=A0AAD6UTL6_9AGAR|nr:hypothetical protein GGX14DRAFT_596506 [Mycena pura]
MAVYYDYYDPYDYEPTFYDAAEPNYAADDDYCDDPVRNPPPRVAIHRALEIHHPGSSAHPRSTAHHPRPMLAPPVPASRNTHHNVHPLALVYGLVPEPHPSRATRSIPAVHAKPAPCPGPSLPAAMTPPKPVDPSSQCGPKRPSHPARIRRAIAPPPRVVPSATGVSSTPETAGPSKPSLVECVPRIQPTPAALRAVMEEFHHDVYEGSEEDDVGEIGGQEQWDEERYVLHHPAEYEDDEEPFYAPENVVSQLSFDPETATDAQIDASAWGVHWFRGPPPGVSPDTWRDDMDEWRLRIEASLEAEAMHPHDDGCEREATALPADDDMYDTRHFWDPTRYDGDPHYGLSVTDNLQPPPSVRKYILEDQAALDADQVPDDRRKEFLEELRLLCEDERYYDRCRAAGFVWNEQCREYFPPPEFWRPEAIHAVHDRRLLPLRLTYPGFGLQPPPATSHPLSRRGRAARSAMPIFRHTHPRSFGSSTRRALRPRDAPPSPTKHPPRRLPRRPPACVAQPVLQLSTVQNRPQSHSCREPPPHLPVLSTTVSMPPLISTSPAPPSAVRDRKEPMPPDRSMVTADDLLDPAASSTSARMVRCGEHPEDTVTLPRAPKPPDIGALGTPSKPTVANGGVAQRRRNAARRIARKAQSARGRALSWGGEGALPAEYCVCVFRSHPFCVHECPHLTACTRIASALRTHVTSIRLPWRRTVTVLPSFTPRSLISALPQLMASFDPPPSQLAFVDLFNRRSAFYTSSSAVVRTHISIPILTSKKAPPRTTTSPAPVTLPSISCAAHRPSFTPRRRPRRSVVNDVRSD